MLRRSGGRRRKIGVYERLGPLPRGTPGGPLLHGDDTLTLTKPVAEIEEVTGFSSNFCFAFETDRHAELPLTEGVCQMRLTRCSEHRPQMTPLPCEPVSGFQ